MTAAASALTLSQVQGVDWFNDSCAFFHVSLIKTKFRNVINRHNASTTLLNSFIFGSTSKLPRAELEAGNTGGFIVMVRKC